TIETAAGESFRYWARLLMVTGAFSRCLAVRRGLFWHFMCRTGASHCSICQACHPEARCWPNDLPEVGLDCHILTLRPAIIVEEPGRSNYVLQIAGDPSANIGLQDDNR